MLTVFTAAVSKERDNHVSQLRKALKNVRTLPKAPQTYKASRLASSVRGRKVPDHQAFRVAARLLHKHAFEVAGPGADSRCHRQLVFHPARQLIPWLLCSTLKLNVSLMRDLCPDAETNWVGTGGATRPYRTRRQKETTPATNPHKIPSPTRGNW